MNSKLRRGYWYSTIIDQPINLNKCDQRSFDAIWKLHLHKILRKVPLFLLEISWQDKIKVTLLIFCNFLAIKYMNHYFFYLDSIPITPFSSSSISDPFFGEDIRPLLLLFALRICLFYSTINYLIRYIMTSQSYCSLHPYISILSHLIDPKHPIDLISLFWRN